MPDGKPEWENSKNQFPTGCTPNEAHIPIEVLIEDKYDQVTADTVYVARNTVIKHEIHKWDKDGAHIIKCEYDVYPFRENRFLSVYGQKMLNDFKENKKNVGFNYTGI